MLSVRSVGSFVILISSASAAFADGETPAAAAKALAMDYGPFLGSTIAMQTAKNGSDLDGIVMKGIAVQLKDAGKVVGAMCFDTMLCRWAGGWLAEEGKPPLKLIGTPFDGSHGTCPKAQGPLVFQTRPVPGWAKDGKLDDPRESPYVPLPRDWAHYSGLNVSTSLPDEPVVLSYEVGGVPISERPFLFTLGDVRWFCRAIDVPPDAKRALTVVICSLPAEADLAAADAWIGADPGTRVDFKDATGQACIAVGSLLYKNAARTESELGQAKLKRIGHELCAEIPASAGGVDVTIMMAHFAQGVPVPEKVRGISRVSVAQGLRDGEARYPELITTQGKLGANTAAYTVDTLTLPDENPWKAWMRPTGFDFFADGKRAALCTWSGDVWTVSGVDETLAKLECRRIATGLFQPLGLKIVDEKIYVLGRDQITRLHDRNGDGEADYYENFNNDVSCTPNYHEFAADLQTDAAGNFYFCKNSPLKGAYEWDKAGPHNGCMLRVSKDGSRLDVIATGLRATNGCGVGPRGEITTGDNEGIWTPVSRINWIGLAGAPAPSVPPFLGALGMDHRAEAPKTYDPPLCWLPWGMDNSPGGQVWAGEKFGPLSGAMLHLSYGKCAIFQVLREEVGGVMQGGIVKLPATFASGAMRGRVNPRDGMLYVCGLRGWQTTAARDGCFQRLRYTGQPLDIVTGLRVRRDALEITVSTPLDPAFATDLGNWDVQWWNYRWTKSYGSDLYSVSDPGKSLGKRGQLKGEVAPLKSASLSADGKTVTLEVPGLAPAMQVMTRANLQTVSGAPFKVEVAHTINRVP
jgi:hypothetical protein